VRRRIGQEGPRVAAPALALLTLIHERRGFEVIGTTTDGLRARLKRLRSDDYRRTVPYLYVNHRPVGGLGDIRRLDGSGTLELLVRGEV